MHGRILPAAEATLGEEARLAPSVTVRWIEGGELRVEGLDGLAAASAASNAWVDVLEPDEATLGRLRESFGLHPLAVEDCLHYPQRPKIDLYPGNVFLIWLAPENPDLRYRDEFHELDVFIGKDFIITIHRERIPAIGAVASDRSCCDNGPDWTAHAILDRLVDGMFPMLDEVGDRLEALEDKMLDSADKHDLEELHVARRRLLAMHKVVSPERDIIRGLARAGGYVSEDAYRYYTDIGDHLARVEDSIETYREVASSAMDIYLSSVSNRLNVVMRQLTVVATIFMPLTLISSIYGMNFRYMPEYGWRYAYPTVLLAMVAIAAGMAVVFRRRGWW